MTAPTDATPVVNTPREVTRTFAAPLEVRAASKGGDGRIVEGICVPFDTPVRIDDELVEEFAPGCCDHQMRALNRIRYKRQHWELLGACIELRNDTAGLFGAFRVARTARGDETLALIEAGALTDLSVGFRTRQDEIVDREDGLRVVRRVRVDLREVSSVEEGAYGEHATVTGTRARVDERTGLLVIDGLALAASAQLVPPAEPVRAAELPAVAPAPDVDEPAGPIQQAVDELARREPAPATPNLRRALVALAAMDTHLAA